MLEGKGINVFEIAEEDLLLQEKADELVEELCNLKMPISKFCRSYS